MWGRIRGRRGMGREQVHRAGSPQQPEPLNRLSSKDPFLKRLHLPAWWAPLSEMS